MNRKGKTSEESSHCYFHPKQIVIGVCPLCLNERLLLLAAKQGHSHSHSSSSRASQRLQGSTQSHRKPPPPHAAAANSIHKIFAFTSLFSRPQSQSRHWRSHNQYYDASPSPDESFISIKFEGNNGVGSWEKNTVSEVSLENCRMSWKNHHHLHPTLMIHNNKGDTGKSVVEHVRSRDPLRWRKRIGHMFHVIRWKKSTASSSSSSCHVGSKVEGVKLRKGWMKTLTKRKSTV